VIIVLLLKIQQIDSKQYPCALKTIISSSSSNSLTIALQQYQEENSGVEHPTNKSKPPYNEKRDGEKEYE
jgi:hypothetical protein